MIKVNVSGKMFEVDINVLIRSDYFKTMIDDCVNDDVIYVKRSPYIFEHVLACLIDDNYKCPIQYQDELKYFLIQHNNWYDPYSDIKKMIEHEIQEINRNIKEIRDSVCNINDKYEQLYNKMLPRICKRDNCNDECLNCYEYCVYHYDKCSYFSYDDMEYCDDIIKDRDHLLDERCAYHEYC